MKEAKESLQELNQFLFFDDEEYIKSLLEEYHNYPKAVKYVQSLGIPESQIEPNLSKIHELIKDLKYCENCPGIEKCKKANPLIISNLKYEFGKVSTELTPCRKIYEKLTLEKQFFVDDFNKEWYSRTIKDIDMFTTRKNVFMRFNKYLKDESDQWIYMCGSANTGRTYLAVLMALEIARKEKGPICFLNSELRFRELLDLSYSDKEKFQQLIDRYSSVPLLVLDDFGTETRRDMLRPYLLQILNKRSNKKLFTIITSDYTISEVVSLYTSSKTKGDSIEAERIGKTLKQECQKEFNLGDISIY